MKAEDGIRYWSVTGVQTCAFFFQAEDGIRDWSVTGVQTCALPIQAEDGIRDWSVTGVQTCALPISGAKPGASVLALEKQTGKEVWKALDDHVSNSSPIAITSGGKRQLIVWSDNSITSQIGRASCRERV